MELSLSVRYQLSTLIRSQHTRLRMRFPWRLVEPSTPIDALSIHGWCILIDGGYTPLHCHDSRSICGTFHCLVFGASAVLARRVSCFDYKRFLRRRRICVGLFLDVDALALLWLCSGSTWLWLALALAGPGFDTVLATKVHDIWQWLLDLSFEEQLF